MNRHQPSQSSQSGSGPDPNGSGDRLVRYVEIRRVPASRASLYPWEDPSDYDTWDLWFHVQRADGTPVWSDCISGFPTWEDAMDSLVRHTVGWVVNGIVVKPSDPDYPDDDVYWTDIRDVNNDVLRIELPIEGKWDPIWDLQEPKHPKPDKHVRHQKGSDMSTTNTNLIVGLDQYQKRALETASYLMCPNQCAGPNPKTPWHPSAYPFLGLASEAGEVLGEFKKGYRGEPLNRQNLKLELGDVLWYVAVCAHELDLTLSELATANINKLAARYGSARPEAPGTCQPSQCI